MAKFIQLTYSDDTESWVNVDHIVAFETSLEAPTLTRVIVSGLAGEVNVKETARQINYLIAT